MEQIILHIGAPKSGSSFLQSHLAHNRPRLRDLGVYYPVTVSPHRSVYRTLLSQHLLSYSLAKWEPFTLFDADNFLADAKRACTRYGMHTMLLSAENMYWLPTPTVLTQEIPPESFWQRKEEFVRTVRDFLAPVPTKVIIYLRRQDRWIESWYNQQIKNGFPCAWDFDSFVTHHAPLLDYHGMLELWARHFGRENILVRLYEKEQMANGLLEDFADSLGLFRADDLRPVDKPKQNTKLSPEALEFLNACNRFDLPPQRKRKLSLTTRKVFHQFDESAVFENQSLLPPCKRIELLERMQPGNEKVAREYLNRADGDLFHEPWPDPADPWEPRPKLDAEFVFRVMRDILAEEEFFQWSAYEKALDGKRRSAACLLDRLPSGLARRLSKILERRLWKRLRFED